MRRDTIRRKIATKGFRQINGDEWFVDQMYKVLNTGKQAFDRLMLDMGRMMAEAIMYIEREEISGPDYSPLDEDIRKWASEPGSVYVGEQKIKVQRPRLRKNSKEILLKSYAQMKEKGQFSEEILRKMIRGMSARKYCETVVESAQAFGVHLIALLTLLIATKVLQLVQARDGTTKQKAEVVFEKEQIKFIQILQKKLEGKTVKQKNPHCIKSFAWASWIVARQGGRNRYASESPPGLITMRRGLEKFSDSFYGWCLGKDMCIG